MGLPHKTGSPLPIIYKKTFGDLEETAAHEVYRAICGRMILRTEIDLNKGVLNGQMRDWNGGK